MTTHSTMSVNITVIHSYTHFVLGLFASTNPVGSLCRGLWFQVDMVVLNVVIDSALDKPHFHKECKRKAG